MITVQRIQEIIEEDERNGGLCYKLHEWEDILQLAMTKAREIEKKSNKKKLKKKATLTREQVQHWVRVEYGFEVFDSNWINLTET